MPTTFNASTTFVCINPAANGYSIAFSGRVITGGNVIVKGQAFDDSAFSFLFACTLDPACSPSPGSPDEPAGASKGWRYRVHPR